MKTILVTGPIGSGKSEVCAYISRKGFPVYDCDSRTKALYDAVPGLKKRIEDGLGVKWKDIGIIFSDASRRTILEGILYPVLLDDIRAWKESVDSPIAFIESAIALDKPAFRTVFDEVLLVTSDYPTRLQRNPLAAQRDSLQNFKDKTADYIIDNSSSIAELHVKIEQFLCKQI